MLQRRLALPRKGTHATAARFIGGQKQDFGLMACLVVGILTCVAVPRLYAATDCSALVERHCNQHSGAPTATIQLAAQKATATTAAESKADKAPKWSPSAKSASSPEDIFRLPDLKTLQAWQQASYADTPTRNPHQRLHGPHPSFPQRYWANRLPFFHSPELGIYTSDYGWRRIGRLDFHGGVDIKAPAGTPVISPISGKIIRVGLGGVQSGVVVQSDDVQHTFWHIRPTRGLAVGQRLEVGAVVGSLFPWGYNTHLHYSIHLSGPTGDPRIRKDAVSIDPLYVWDRIFPANRPAQAELWYRQAFLPFAMQQDDQSDTMTAPDEALSQQSKREQTWDAPLWETALP